MVRGREKRRDGRQKRRRGVEIMIKVGVKERKGRDGVRKVERGAGGKREEREVVEVGVRKDKEAGRKWRRKEGGGIEKVTKDGLREDRGEERKVEWR